MMHYTCLEQRRANIKLYKKNKNKLYIWKLVNQVMYVASVKKRSIHLKGLGLEITWTIFMTLTIARCNPHWLILKLWGNSEEIHSLHDYLQQNVTWHGLAPGTVQELRFDVWGSRHHINLDSGYKTRKGVAHKLILCSKSLFRKFELFGLCVSFKKYYISQPSL